jgi:hypothetical protein
MGAIVAISALCVIAVAPSLVFATPRYRRKRDYQDKIRDRVGRISGETEHRKDGSDAKDQGR